MERKQIIGFILIFATIMLWTIATKPSEAELNKTKNTQDSIAQAIKLDSLKAIASNELATSQAITSDSVPASDSLKAVANQGKFGGFAMASIGQNSDEVLENELMRVTFSSKGGKIKEVFLKKHFRVVTDHNKVESKEPIKILDNSSNKFEYRFPMGNGFISSEDLYFTPTVAGNTVSFKANLGEGKYFEQKYTLTPDSYNLDYSLKTEGLDNIINKGVNTLPLYWENHLDKYEKGVAFEQNYSTAYFKEQDENRDYCSCVSDDKKEINEKPIEWISNTNQFFNTSLVAVTAPFKSAVLTTRKMDIVKDTTLKEITNLIDIPFANLASGTYDMKMYIGPNEYKRLEQYNVKLEEIIPFGSSIFGTINRWAVRPFFDFLSTFIGSKGLVILLLIFIIKMALYPLMYKMLFSQAKMSALKPELAHLKEKFKDDTSKQQMETMKIYREYGVSPLGGCLPMVLQMPIWYALFRFFPASITFRQESFLWANDLSSYDVLFYLPFDVPFFGAHVSLFTLLWAVSTIVYTYYNMQSMDLSANPAMKYVQYAMPVMFLAFFNNYASGLTCYMFFSNLINIIQTIVTKNYIFDESKIRAELMKEKGKPKKQGGFQAKLEEAMKQQKAIQEQKASKK